MLRALDQSKFGLKDDDAGAFCSDQSPRHVESPIRKQFVQVVAGDTPRNTGKFRANQVAIPVPNGPELAVNFAATAALSNNKIKVVFWSRSDSKLRAVVKQNAQLFNIA